jgi:phosphohistidine phosphatase
VDVYLVRHAIAAQRDGASWPDDSKRPLTENGIDRFRQAGRGLAKIVPNVDRVLSSPYRRAWETAEILHTDAGWPAPEPCPELEAVRTPPDILPVLWGAESSSIALVGHEPLLSRLASLLLTGQEDALPLELKKGGAIFLEIAARPDASRAVLRWSLSPKILRRLDPSQS